MTDLLPAAAYLPKKKRGRPSKYRQFLEHQVDMFPFHLLAACRVDSKPSAAAERAAGEPAAAEGGALPPVTNRGGKVKTDERAGVLNA